MFKSNKGFTLVELIVVIAILAILAGVAIPVYNGYIKRAQDAAVVTELDAIQTAAQAANATVGGIEYIVVDGTDIYVGGPDAYLSANFNDDFALFYPEAGTAGELGVFTGAGIELKGSYTNGATWTGGEWAKEADSSLIEEQNPVEFGSSVGGQGAHRHTWDAGTVTKDATCGETGTKTFTCSGCDQTKTETIAATGRHDKGADNKCTVCGTTLGENWELPPVTNP